MAEGEENLKWTVEEGRGPAGPPSSTTILKQYFSSFMSLSELLLRRRGPGGQSRQGSGGRGAPIDMTLL